jgi:hypothetical protein
MTDSTTSAADKLGANKSTNAIPQEVCYPFIAVRLSPRVIPFLTAPN